VEIATDIPLSDETDDDREWKEDEFGREEESEEDQCDDEDESEEDGESNEVGGFKESKASPLELGREEESSSSLSGGG
jgi:hypothetical protein